MVRHLFRFAVGPAFLLALFAQAPAQPPPGRDKDDTGLPKDYRHFFKQPENLTEYWDALQFEIELGKYDLAAQQLHGLMSLKAKPSDDDLVALEEKVGMAAFLGLRNVPKWSDNPDVQKQAEKEVQDLITQVRQAVKNKLADPKRIQLYVKNLNGSPEESAFAVKELYRSGVEVVPYLVEQIQAAKSLERLNLLDALRRLSPETLPPLYAALDSDDPDLQTDLIDLFEKRAAKGAVPFLWRLTAPDQPERVRRKATEALAYLLEVQEAKLPTAKVPLTREAERYYLHQVPFPIPDDVTVWRWDDATKKIVRGWPGVKVTQTKAEEYYGLRFVKQALAVDPSYQPAQVLLLSLAVDKAAEQAGLAKTPAAVQDLLSTVNPDLVVALLERAVTERRTPVVLGAIRTLGDLAEVRAERAGTHGEPTLVRALLYPDRRVQFAAAEALLRMPGPPSPQATTRVVEILRGALAAEAAPAGKSKVLVGVTDDVSRRQTEDAVKKAGGEPIPAATGREVLRRLAAAADVDVILLDSTLPDPGLNSLLAQLRGDPHTSGLPVVVAAIPEGADIRDLQRRLSDLRSRLDVIDQRIKEVVDPDSKALLQAMKDLRGKIRTARRLDPDGKEPLDRTDEERDDVRRLGGFFKEKEEALTRHAPDLERLWQDYDKVDRDLLSAVNQYIGEVRRRQDALRRFLDRYPNVRVVSEADFHDPDAVANSMKRSPDESGPPLVEAELKENAEKAIRLLARLAKGEPEGYDARPAAEAVYGALRGDKLSPEGQLAAVEVVGRFGGTRPQTELANVVLDPKRPAKVRTSAAAELIRHIQTHGDVLAAAQVESLASKDLSAGADADLKAQLALLMGALRPDARLSGERLLKYNPPPPGPAVPPPPPPQPPPPKDKDK